MNLTCFTESTSEASDEFRLILRELASLSGKIQLEAHDIVAEAQLAKTLAVGRVPALIVSSKTTRGAVRFFGTPAGYEFPNLLASVMDASTGETNLRRTVKDVISGIDKRVEIQVFVTPTCPYCGPVARLAHQIAFENTNVTADVIEINEFEDLARRYRIQGVPKTVINDNVEFIGEVSDEQFLEYLKRAI